MSESNLFNDRNVYILGAGFSSEAGMPLIRNFMNRMRDAEPWLAKEKGRNSECEAIQKVLAFRLRAAAAAYRVPIDVENIEDLFSLATAAGNPDLSDAMRVAIAATLDYARKNPPRHLPTPLNDPNFIVGILKEQTKGWKCPKNWSHHSQPNHLLDMREWYSCPPYEFYLGMLCGYFSDNPDKPERHNTIITLNYDMVVEDALNALDFAYCYGTGRFGLRPEEKQKWQSGQHLQILKLHGSVNWHQDEAWDGQELSDVPKVRADELARKIVPLPDYDALRQTGTQPLIVPPTWQKGGMPALASIWDDAVIALRYATRIVIMGYSLPRTDIHFKYLLAAGLQDNISLRKVLFVNPALKGGGNEQKIEAGKQQEERIRGVFQREHLDQDVVELVPATVREFLGSWDWLSKLERTCDATSRYDNTARWHGQFGSSLCAL